MKAIQYILLMLALALTACVNDSDVPADSLQPGDMLPEFSVVMSDGSIVSTRSLSGRRSVICLFNTGCQDCRQELPELQRAYEICSAMDSQPQFVCIARDENAADIAEFWKTNNLTLPYSSQDGRSIYELFAKSGIPRIYISDESLKIIAAYGDTSMPTADEIVRQLK